MRIALKWRSSKAVYLQIRDRICGLIQTIQKLCFQLDKLIYKFTKAKCRQKKRMKLAATRLRGKIKNLVDELHKKTREHHFSQDNRATRLSA